MDRRRGALLLLLILPFLAHSQRGVCGGEAEGGDEEAPSDEAADCSVASALIQQSRSSVRLEALHLEESPHDEGSSASGAATGRAAAALGALQTRLRAAASYVQHGWRPARYFQRGRLAFLVTAVVWAVFVVIAALVAAAEYALRKRKLQDHPAAASAPPEDATRLPILIVGTGLSGLAAARECQKRGRAFQLVDKQTALGGCWLSFGNKTSKLQSDSGSYDVDMDQPHCLSSYPSKEELMAYILKWYHEHNLGEHAAFGTELRRVVPDGVAETYVATCAKGPHQHVIRARAVLAAPGRLRTPVRQRLEGEDVFLGAISYGVSDDFRSASWASQEVVVLGHGSFSVECMRTCLDFGAAKVTILCRRRNLVLPRAARLAVSRRLGGEQCSTKQLLGLCGPAYRLLGLECCSLSTVSVSEEGEVSLQQTRPPVSDLYFLAQYCGKAEVLLDSVSHLTATAVCTKSYRRQLPAAALFKCLGFELADPHFDQVMGLQKMVGMWADGDPGRFVLQEPVGKVSFATWPIPYANPHFVYLFYFFRALQHRDFLRDLHGRLPVCSTSAYDGSHVSESLRILSGSLDDAAQQELAVLQDRPARRAREAHPWSKFLAEQRAEWQAYSKSLGAKETPEYPYTEEGLESFERNPEAPMASGAGGEEEEEEEEEEEGEGVGVIDLRMAAGLPPRPAG